LFEAAAHNPAIAKRVGIPQETAAKMSSEGIKKPMNPVMHTHHPMEAEVKAGRGSDYDELRHDEHPGEKGKVALGPKARPAKEKGPFRAGRAAHHVMFGPGEGRGSGFEKGGGREHPEGGLKYLRGGQDAPLHASPDNFGKREGHDGHYTGEYRSNDEKSAKMEGAEFGSEGLKENLGSKRKSGYGNPQGGTTDERHEGDLGDETRGTQELPAHQFSAKHAVPQEARERLAKALLRRR
jgi:hypothetical protein